MKCGSPGYIAPEIFTKDQYGKQVDIFSIGVVLFILLSGSHPFGSDMNKMLKKNRDARIYFTPEDWTNVSRDAIDLVMQLTDPNPATRITAAEAVRHHWIWSQISN
jgi:serine/threonine protein kinase